MSSSRKILIIGNKYHGKTTFANFLKDALGDAQAYSTSSYLIYRLGMLKGVSTEEILKEKEKYRPDLIELGNAMCNVDAGCLVSICLWSCHKTFALIDGVRRISEFERVKSMFETVIWINRPSEPIGRDNLELKAGDANMVIDNTGTLDDLRGKAQNLAKKLQSARG